MNIILGNGLNYEQFGNLEWKEFNSHFDNRLRERFEVTPDGFIKKFLSKILSNVLNEKHLEKKLAFSDLEVVAGSIDYIDWMSLTHDGLLDSDVLSAYWNIVNEVYDFQGSQLENDDILRTLSTLSMVYFTTLHLFFNDAIHDVLKLDYQMDEKQYTRDFVKFLKSFENIATLNVDGVLNRSIDDGIYPHGYLNYSDPKEYYDMQMKKVKHQNPEMLDEFIALAKSAKTNPYEIEFNYSSGRKIKDIEFANKLNNSELNLQYEIDFDQDYMINNWNKNKHLNNVDLDFYTNIKTWTGNVLIVGVSAEGDEAIFDLLNKNKNVQTIYYYGNRSEYNKIKSKKTEYCGLWNKDSYSFRNIK